MQSRERKEPTYDDKVLALRIAANQLNEEAKLVWSRLEDLRAFKNVTSVNCPEEYEKLVDRIMDIGSPEFTVVRSHKV